MARDMALWQVYLAISRLMCLSVEVSAVALRQPSASRGLSFALVHQGMLMLQLRHTLRASLLIPVLIAIIMAKVIHAATMRMDIAVVTILVVVDAILSLNLRVRMLERHVALITEVHLTMVHSLIHLMIEVNHLNLFAAQA